jgi:hypothetical protein
MEFSGGDHIFDSRTAFARGSTIKRCVIVGRRVTPVALVAGLVIMVLILLYTAFNRAHEVSPQTPAPQTHQR